MASVPEPKHPASPPQPFKSPAGDARVVHGVAARIAELQDVAKQIANERFAMSAEELLYRLTLIARASIADYMQLDKTGQPTIAFANATPAQMYALNECSVDDIETKRDRGKRTKIKLTDRISALKLIGSSTACSRARPRSTGHANPCRPLAGRAAALSRPIAWRLSQDGVRSSAHDEHAIRRAA